MNNSFLGTGWSFPPSFEKGNYQLELSSEVDNINQSINLILQTPRFSRSLVPKFGSELAGFLFRTANASLKEEIEESIRLTLLNDEPRITVNKVDVKFVKDTETLALVSIYYTVKKTNARHNHVFPFSLLEGTNLKVVE